MTYLEWSERDIAGLRKHKAVAVILLEVDDDGVVMREIGLDAKGDIVHRSPSKNDPRGLLDTAPIDLTNVESNLSQSRFEWYWNQ